MNRISDSLKLFYFTAILTMVQVMTFAQETSGGGSSTSSGSSSTSSSTKVEISNDTGNWFANNWIWVVGVIVFIILLFALLGGSSSSRRTTVVREDTGTGRVSRTTTVDDDL
jgi:hypothetical protein